MIREYIYIYIYIYNTFIKLAHYIHYVLTCCQVEKMQIHQVTQKHHKESRSNRDKPQQKLYVVVTGNWVLYVYEGFKDRSGSVWTGLCVWLVHVTQPLRSIASCCFSSDFCKNQLVCREKNVVSPQTTVLFPLLLLLLLLQFAPEVHVGDGLGMDLKLSNQVFNSLKQHCYSEQRRSARLHEKKEHSTAVCTDIQQIYSK